MCNVLRELNRSLSKLYAGEGRPSIWPEEGFVGLSLDDAAWDPTICESACKKDPLFGVIGFQSGPLKVEVGMLVVEAIARRVKAAKHLLILFRFGHKNSRPIRRWGTCLERLYTCRVQIK